ncbi:hypothetical protein [Nonomuraea roseoviolacea]
MLTPSHDARNPVAAAVPVFLTRTSPWKPPASWPVFLNVAGSRQARRS